MPVLRSQIFAVWSWLTVATNNGVEVSTGGWFVPVLETRTV